MSRLGRSAFLLNRFSGAWICWLAVGCAVNIPPPSGGGNGNGGPQNGGGSDGSGRPVVSLIVSNTAPQVGEQVFLRCVIESGEEGTPRFAFDSVLTRLNVNTDTGRADFIVSESDVGTAFQVSCSVSNELGESDASDAVLITPTAAP